jgi:hypothetical protein
MKPYPISIREKIMQALITTLSPVAKDMGAKIFRSPVFAILREQTPAIVVFPVEEVTGAQNTQTLRKLTVRVVALAREVDGTNAEIVADQLIVAVNAALMANNNMGGLCTKIREIGTEWDIEDADARAAAIPVKYEFEYRTHINDLTLKA